MNDKEIQQLVELAEKLLSEVSREKAMSSFVSAGILTAAGKFTEPYEELQGVMLVAQD